MRRGRPRRANDDDEEASKTDPAQGDSSGSDAAASIDSVCRLWACPGIRPTSPPGPAGLGEHGSAAIAASRQCRWPAYLPRMNRHSSLSHLGALVHVTCSDRFGCELPTCSTYAANFAVSASSESDESSEEVVSTSIGSLAPKIWSMSSNSRCAVSGM